MRCTFLLALLLAVLPLAVSAAAMDLPDDAAVEATAVLATEEMVVIDRTQDPGPDPEGSPCQRAAEETATGGAPSYILPLPGGEPGFRFTESGQENGCAEARFAVAVPGGTGWSKVPSELVVSFRADRQVGQSTAAAAPRAVQDVRLYDDPAGACQVDAQDLLATLAYYTASSSGETRLLPFEWRVDLDELGQRPRTVCIGWYFGDQMRMSSAADLGVNQGQSFSSTVMTPSATFVGGTVAATSAHHDGVSPDGQLVGYATVSFDISRLEGPHARRVEVTVDADHGMHSLEAWTEGRWRGLTPTAFTTAEDRDGLRVVLADEALATYDRFRLTFRAPDTATLQPTQVLVAAPLLVLPIVVGIVAQNAVRTARERAAGRVRTPVVALQALAVAGWTAFVTTVLLLLFSGTSLFLLAWPLEPVALFAYVVMLGVVALDLAVTAWARRLERRLMRRDLTERERMQQELERTNRDLAQFAYVASHDLKEPLRMVAGYTRLLERRYGDLLDPKGRQYVAYATDGATRMQRMIDDLLAYSRVRPEDEVPVSMADAAEIAKRDLEPMARAKGARIQVGPLPRVRGTPAHLVQLFHNLLDNALKFNDRRPVIRISASRHGSWVIAVRDNGIGIPQGQERRIFEIFQRLHGRSEFDGNGIGLALCRKIVEQSGGRIWVEQTPGRGATFKFTWPDIEKGLDAADHPEEIIDLPGRGQRVRRGTGPPRAG